MALVIDKGDYRIHVVDNARSIPYPEDRIIGLDIESSPLPEYVTSAEEIKPDPRLQKIVLVQIAIDDDIYVLVRNFEGVKYLLEDPDIVKVIHNASFECKFLKHHCNITIRNIYDTFLVEGVFESGRQPVLTLENVVKKYLDIDLSKKIRKRFIKGQKIDEEMIDYAARDAWVLPKLYRIMTEFPETYKYEADKVLALEHKLVSVVTAMELNGILLDKKKWTSLAAEKEIDLVSVKRNLLASLPTQTKRFSILGGEVSDINLNSKDSVLDILQRAGLDIPDLKKTTVAEILEHTEHPVLRLYADYQKLQKAVTTYGEDFLKHVNPVTGRVHQSVKQIETRTGRFAGSDPNLMNIPRDPRYRECFCAPEGKKLVTFDYSQQELRILAEYSGDRGLIEAFEQNIDIHVYVARILFRDPAIDKNSPKRNMAKGLNFGLVYGMGVKSLAKHLKITVDEAQELMNEHARSFPGAFAWMQDTINFAKRHGYVETLLGRRRNLDTQVHDYEGQARNTPIQGTAADVTKCSLVLLNKRGLKIVNVVHDEICIECDDADVQDVMEVTEKCMIAGAGMLVKNVPFKAEGAANQVWKK